MSRSTRYLIGGFYALACLVGLFGSLIAAMWWWSENKQVLGWMAFTAAHLFFFASTILTTPEP